jgi:hypothetical protein
VLQPFGSGMSAGTQVPKNCEEGKILFSEAYGLPFLYFPSTWPQSQNQEVCARCSKNKTF